MAKKNRGLGMGLDALFSETESAYENAKYKGDGGSSEGQTEIELSKIVANPNQPRKNFDENALRELAESIKTHGVIQPIIVNNLHDGTYMIIAGERRYRAAKLAVLDTVPAIVKEYDDQTVKEISIIENLQREDLNAVEEARAIKQLMEEFSFTQEKVAERLGKSRPAIANTLRLLSLTETVLKMIEDGNLSAGHARTLVVCTDSAMQIELAKKAVSQNLSVRDFERLVKLALSKPINKEEQVKNEISLELQDLVNRMQRIFATKVHVIGNDKKGRISVDYFSRDDLDRICELMENLEK